MLEIKEVDFEKEVTQSDKLVLLDFYAPWCPPCKALVPVLETLATKNPGLKVVKINTDEEVNLGTQYQIAALPTLVFVKNRNHFSGISIRGPTTENHRYNCFRLNRGGEYRKEAEKPRFGAFFPIKAEKSK